MDENLKNNFFIQGDEVLTLYDIILLAIALGADAFSVAVVLGARQLETSRIVKFSSVTGIFHVLMPLAGLLTGLIVRNLVTNFLAVYRELDYIFEVIGAGVLLIIGFYMIVETFIDSQKELEEYKLCGRSMCVIAFSVSIDSFAVGLGLGMIDFSVLLVMVIGITAALMMGLGLYLGSILDYRLPVNTQFWGGVALILLGLRFLGVL